MPLPLATLWEIAAYHPQFGYYRRGQQSPHHAAQHLPLGKNGDFITAPEISQMFGEVLAAWFIQGWQQMGCPSPCAYIELGGGRGTLMADILRICQRYAPTLYQALELHLLESHEDLRLLQQQAAAGKKVTFHDDLGSLPNMPFLLMANEFFDCLPIEQYVFDGQSWRQRTIKMQEGKLAWGVGEKVVPSFPAEAPLDLVIEKSPMSEIFAAQLANYAQHNHGYGLIIDYGYISPPKISTIQAVFRHERVDFLSTLGAADISALVNFQQLQHIFQQQHLGVSAITSQTALLQRLGLPERATQLKKHANITQKAEIEAAMVRLLHPLQMGGQFLALSFHHPQIPAMLGFS